MWKRSWFRWTVRCVALLLLALLAVTFYYRSRGANELAEARMEFEAKVGPLEPMAYKPRPVPEEENGAVWLLAGAQAVVIFQLEKAGLGVLARTPSTQWTPEQIVQLEAIQERNAPALALLYRAAGMKVCDLNAVMGEGERVGLPAIHAARLLAADARDALRQEDVDRFFKNAQALSTSASAMERAPETILLLLGSYEERLLLPVLQEAATSRILDAAALARLQSLLPTTDLADLWRRECGKGIADLESRLAFEASGRDDNGQPTRLWYRFHQFLFGDLDQAWALRTRVQIVEERRGSYAQRQEAKLPPHDHPWKIGPWSVITNIETPSLLSALVRLQATLALREMTRQGLEIRRAGLERSAYPTDLSSFPGAKTPDPFTGKPVAYTLHPDGSATLAIPDADALYRKLTEGKRAAIGFTWTLPPVTAGKPSPSRHPAW